MFEVESPDGPRALKIYDARFSEGKKGEIDYKRVEQQLALRGHDCPYLVQIYDGGKVEGRLFLLMGRAPGTELGKRLKDIPRDKIRPIVDQVARAAIFLRGKGLCHRDIKAANVFISDDFKHCTLLDISVIRRRGSKKFMLYVINPGNLRVIDDLKSFYILPLYLTNPGNRRQFSTMENCYSLPLWKIPLLPEGITNMI